MPRKPGDPWIKLTDFAELSVWISVTNSNTGTKVASGPEVDLTEFSDHGLTLTLPAGSCAVGQLLMVELKKERKGPVAQKSGKKGSSSASETITVTAKVTEVVPLGTKSKTVMLKFYRVDALHWKIFIQDFIKKQDSIQAMTRTMKE